MHQAWLRCLLAYLCSRRDWLQAIAAPGPMAQDRRPIPVNSAMSIYVSVRAANGKAISKENPSFVAGGVGGAGSGRPGLPPAWCADFVSVPITNCVTAGGSHAQRMPSVVLSSLIGPMAALQQIGPSDLYEIGYTMARQGRVGGICRLLRLRPIKAFARARPRAYLPQTGRAQPPVASKPSRLALATLHDRLFLMV